VVSNNLALCIADSQSHRRLIQHCNALIVSIGATVRDKDMNMIYICKNDDDGKLRKAIYIGDGGPDRSLIP
jgi:hypothetical protein